MKRMTMILALTTLAALAASPLMAAGIPGTINLQGRLTDPAGNNVADGVYTLAFKIYDTPAGGTPLWSETLPVQVTGGLFTVLVGNSAAIPADLFSSGASRYLGIAVNLDPEMPRIPLSSIAYAYQAKDADVAALALDLTCVGCVSASEVDPAQVQLRVTGTAPVGEYITAINQNGTVTTAADANNAYTAGTGLVLNGTQFAIPPDGVTATEIAANAVGSAEIAAGAVVGGLGGDIADATITADDLGTNSVGADEIAAGAVVGGSGGDILDGTISADDIAADAVGVSEIATDAVTDSEIAAGAVTSDEILDATVQFGDLGQNGAVGNQVIKWNGTRWVAGLDDVGAGGGGGDITGVSPGTGLVGGGLSGDVTLGIALGGVTRDEILDGTISAPDLGTNSVGADEIAASAVVGGLGGDVADGTLTADDLGTNSVGADEIAAAAVVGGLAGDVADGTLTADDLGTNSVGADEIATGAVGSAEIAVDAVGAAQIALGAVGSSEVADNSLLGTDIADGTLTADDLAAGAVVGGLGGDIADGTLTHDDLGTGSVNANEIGIGAVNTSGVLDNSLLAADISDEPGVASNTDIAGITMDGTVQTLLSRTITTPASGYILVIATGKVGFGHTNGTNSQAYFGVSDAAGSFPANQAVEVFSTSAAPTGTHYQAVTVHGLFSVSSGASTFYFLGDEAFGNFFVFERQLTLIYLPTAYGTVVSTAAPSGPDVPGK